MKRIFGISLAALTLASQADMWPIITQNDCEKRGGYVVIAAGTRGPAVLCWHVESEQYIARVQW